MQRFKNFAAFLSIVFAIATLAVPIWSIAQYNTAQEEANEYFYQCAEQYNNYPCAQYFKGMSSTLQGEEPSLSQAALKASYELKDAEADQFILTGVVAFVAVLAVWGGFHLAYLWGSHTWKRENNLD